MSELLHRSPWNLHRLFRRVAGETPKRYDLRVRLDRAAAELVSTDHQVSRIAFDHGFTSHEGFSRAFARHFGMAPTAYRHRGLVGPDERRVIAAHAEAVATTSPCTGLYRMSTVQRKGRSPMTVDVQVEDRPALIMLAISRRTTRDEIAAVLAECLPRVFGYAMKHGLTLTGSAMSRYPEMGMSSIVIECGTTVAEAPESAPDGEIQVLPIPAGPAAVAIHLGPYDELHTTYQVIEEWIVDNGYVAAGPPREVYLTDPGEHPDPATWQTEITLPVARRTS